MSSILLDTHAAVWYLSESRRISKTALTIVSKAIADKHPVFVSAISIVEMIYLIERGRIERIALDYLRRFVKDPSSGFQLLSVDYAVSQMVEFVPRDVVPDMPDRIIAATAMALDIPLVTCDSRIRRCRVSTIW